MIKDNLEQKYFEVKVNSSDSRPRPIKAGVPQGGVLSPTLFSIIINDILVKNDDKSKEYSMLFADDMSYIITSKNLTAEQGKIQKILDGLNDWMDSWQLRLIGYNIRIPLHK